LQREKFAVPQREDKKDGQPAEKKPAAFLKMIGNSYDLIKPKVRKRSYAN
jgi:hypothetical protein